MLDIYPEKFSSYVGKRNSNFCLLVTPELHDQVRLHDSELYQDVFLLTCKHEEDINQLLKSKKLHNSDIFFIPFGYDQFNPLPKYENVSHHQRILVASCLPSTPNNLKQVAMGLEAAYKTDVESLVERAGIFFDKLDGCSGLYFINQVYNTSAFLMLDEDCVCTEILGNLGQGEFGLMPSGEVALSQQDFKNINIPTFHMQGEIILQGHSIVHLIEFRNTQALQFQEKIYTSLLPLLEHGVKVTLEQGEIISMQPMHDSAAKACEGLQDLFALDKQYKKITELGVGMNPNIQLVEDNCSMNEAYGGEHNCLHVGLGTSSTRYHVDILCPGTVITTDTGHVLVGQPEKNKHLLDVLDKKHSKTMLQRNQNGHCVCRR